MTKQLDLGFSYFENIETKNLSESQDLWTIYWIVIMGQFIDTSGA